MGLKKTTKAKKASTPSKVKTVKKTAVKKAVKAVTKKNATKTPKEKAIKKTDKVKVIKEKEEKSTKKVSAKNSTLQKKSVSVAETKKKSKKKGKSTDDEELEIELDTEEVIVDDEEEEISVPLPKSKKKNVKEPKKIVTFVNPITSLTVSKPTTKKPAKEPKGKFALEYVIGTSPAILFEFLSTPSGLSEWFADDVNIRDGVFTFFWDGSEQKAQLLDFKEEVFIRFQWLDKPEGSYFEFKLEIDELTSDVSLLVTDFADEASDLKTSTLLWDSQIHDLMHVIGSY